MAVFMWTKVLCHIRLMTELEKTLTTELDKSRKSGHHSTCAICRGTQNFENRYCKLLFAFLLLENPSSTNSLLPNSSLSATKIIEPKVSSTQNKDARMQLKHL
jgi:hypothetical protein